VDAAVLVVTRRRPPLLPVAVSRKYAAFVAREFRSNASARDRSVRQWVEEFRELAR
jgi:hypothetical protein